MPAGDKLWKIGDLAEFLGYESTESAVAAVKANGIPHIILGGGVIADRGAVARARFAPSQVHAWAVSAQQVIAVGAGDTSPAPAAHGAGRAAPSKRPAPERARKVGPRSRR